MHRAETSNTAQRPRTQHSCDSRNQIVGWRGRGSETPTQVRLSSETLAHVSNVTVPGMVLTTECEKHQPSVDHMSNKKDARRAPAARHAPEDGSPDHSLHVVESRDQLLCLPHTVQHHWLAVVVTVRTLEENRHGRHASARPPETRKCLPLSGEC